MDVFVPFHIYSVTWLYYLYNIRLFLTLATNQKRHLIIFFSPGEEADRSCHLDSFYSFGSFYISSFQPSHRNTTNMDRFFFYLVVEGACL